MWIAPSLSAHADFGPQAFVFDDGSELSTADTDPDLATDGSGNWVAVWSSNDSLVGTVGTDADIFVSRSSDNGATWSAVAAIDPNAATDTGEDNYPRIQTDGNGVWIAVWDNVGINYSAADVLYARSTDNGATWSAATTIHPYTGINVADDDLYPSIVTDGQGNWIVTWFTNSFLDGSFGSDLEVLYTRSSDGGLTWTSPAVLNSTATSDTTHDGLASIATDNAGNWVATWESYDSGFNESDIFSAQSTDNGATWSAPVAVNLDPGSDTARDQIPSLVTDGAGNWIVVWYVQEPSNILLGTDGDILVARSVDNGATWSTPEVLTENAFADTLRDRFPRLATDAAGTWIVLWESRDQTGISNPDYDVVMTKSTDSGVTWSTPVFINSNSSTSAWERFPVVATDRNGNWMFACQSTESLGGTIGNDYDILFSRSTNAGDTWSAVAALNSNATSPIGLNDMSPSVASDGAGHHVVVWSRGLISGGATDIVASQSADHGTTWSAPVMLEPGAGAGFFSESITAIATNGQGVWLAAWEATGLSGSDSDLRVSRSVDNGATWTTPDFLNTSFAVDTGNDKVPSLSVDGNGHWVAVWSSTESFSGTLGGEGDILVSRSTDNGTTWTAPTPLNSGASSDSRVDLSPEITTDRLGNWVAVWDSYDTLGGTFGTDADILASRSADNGATWTAPAPLNSNAASDSGYDVKPSLATNEAGTWIVTWQSINQLDGSVGSDEDIFVARSTDNGLTWSAIATVNAAATDGGTDARSQIASAGGQQWITVWFTNDSLGGTIGSDGDILFSRSSNDGVTWTEPKPLNSDASTEISGSANDDLAVVTPDGTGRWLALWMDSVDASIPGGPEFDIMVAKSIAPTVQSITRTNPIVSNAVTVEFTVEFSTAVSGLDVNDFTLTTSGVVGATINSVQNDSGLSTTVLVDTGTGDGTIRLDVVDDDSIVDASLEPLGGLGVGNGDFSAGPAFTIDKTGPDIALSSSAPDPTTGAITVDIVPSQITSNLGEEDITVTNATVSGFTVAGSNYFFLLTPISEGSFSAQINAGVCTDAVGNPNTASNVITRVLDLSGPTVVLSSASGNPTNGPISVSVVLSESSTTFTSSDITAINGVVSDFAGSGSAYSFVLTPTSDGEFSAFVGAAVCTDGLGNPNVASNAITYTFDSQVPSVNILTSAPSFTTVSPIPVTAVFSEPVIGFSLADISVVNGTPSNLTGINTTYHFDVTPTTSGAVVVDIPGDGCTDLAGNNNLASNTLTRTFSNSMTPGTLTGSIAGAFPVSPGVVETRVIRNALVRIIGLESDYEQLTPGDLNGVYRFRDLPIGSYRLEVYAPSFATGEFTVEIKDGALSVVRNVVLDPANPVAGITGTVVDLESGNPIIGIRVDAYVGQDTEPRKTTYTGGDGTYEISGLLDKAAEDVRVEFSAPAYETVEVTVTITPEEPLQEENVSAEKNISAPGSLAGTILVGDKAAGDPIQDARVVVSGLIFLSATTDVNGVYRFDALLEGTYGISISKIGYETIEDTVDVTSLETTDYSVDPKPTPSPPVARVEDVDGNADVDAIDVQLLINAALGLISGPQYDVNRVEGPTAVDVQLVILAALGN